MSAIKELTEKLRTGKLTCVGPKHFPPKEYRGEEGYSSRVAKELDEEMFLELQSVVSSLKDIQRRYCRFELELPSSAGKDVLKLVSMLKAKRKKPGALYHMLEQFLTLKMDGKMMSRLKKQPQLDNVIKFLETTIEQYHSRKSPSGELNVNEDFAEI